MELVRPKQNALLAGDRDAWQNAIAIHNPRVVMALVARRVPLHLAEDFAQDAWAKVFAQCKTFTHIELPGLAIRQAMFLAQDAARVQRRIGTGESDPVFTLTPENEIAARQRLKTAHLVIDALSPRTQALFVRCYNEPELSHADIAAQFGVSVQHVRQTLYEVRARIREKLEKT